MSSPNPSEEPDQTEFLSFNIDELSPKYDQNILIFFKGCPNLVTITLTQSFRIEFPLLAETIGCKLMDLENLDLRGIILSQQEILHLSHCCTLRNLAIRFNADTEAIGRLFKHNSCLKSVHLVDCFRKVRSNCCRFLPSTLKSIKLNVCVLSNYLNVNSLFENKYNVFLESLETFTPHLEHLCIDVSKCANLETVQEFKQLTTLTLRNQDPITGDILKLIAENCTKLQKLDLHPISESIQQEDIAHFAMLNNLNDLALEGSQNTVELYEEEALNSLENCEKLRVLKIVHLRCEDKTADKIVDCCRNLNRVHLENTLVTTDFINLVIMRLALNTYRTEDLHLILPDVIRGNIRPPMFELGVNPTRLHTYLIVDGADPFYDYRPFEEPCVQPEQHEQNKPRSPPPTPPPTPPATTTPPPYLELECLDLDNLDENY